MSVPKAGDKLIVGITSLSLLSKPRRNGQFVPEGSQFDTLARRMIVSHFRIETGAGPPKSYRTDLKRALSNETLEIMGKTFLATPPKI